MRVGRATGGALAIVALALAASACGQPGGADNQSEIVAEFERIDAPTSAPTSAPKVPTSNPGPTNATPTPAAATPSPVAATPSPVAATPAPAAATPAPAAATPVPVASNPPPAGPVERSGAPAIDVIVADPVAIRIPSIGVDSTLVATGLAEDGSVAVPPDANVAGWFDRGPRPGERGPAVIMGHVDSARTGPGVFYRLRDIAVGDVVTVDAESGSMDFVVERVEQYPKLEFPTAAVYGPTPGPALRLVTCGGSFDRSVRSYDDNIIVFLVPTAAS